jgi:outer membrane protein TolC
MKQRYLIFWILLQTFASANSQALSLSEYLQQVDKQNKSAEANVLSRQSGLDMTREKDLLLAPNLIFNTQYKDDQSLPMTVGITYDEMQSLTTVVGVRKLTTFGLIAELDYEYDDLYAKNAALGVVTFGDVGIYSSHPTLTLTQSLWSNGFGRGTRAIYDLDESQGLQKSLNAQYQGESLRQDAEVAYWQLANARRQIQIQTQAVAQAKRIWDWNIRRRSNNLNETSDLLQAKAAYETRSLDLQTAVDQERELAQRFNALRFVDSSEVTDNLEQLPDATLLKMPVPQQTRTRSDVKAAEQGMRMATASAQTSIEHDKPTFDVFVSYAQSGQDTSSSKAIANMTKPTSTIGLKFLMPLDFDAMNTARQGYHRDELAAQYTYQQKMFDEQKDWKNLTLKFSEAQRRYALATEIEETQKEKLLNERQRFQNGRTTTYQVLMFEQDYLLAQITRIKMESDILGLIAQMRLYQTSS